MSDNQTRGAFVRNAIILPALAGLVAGTGAVASAQAGKGEKSTYKYQDTPKNGQQCSGCTFFLPNKTATANGQCKVVAGDISPKGWCIAFSPKG